METSNLNQKARLNQVLLKTERDKNLVIQKIRADVMQAKQSDFINQGNQTRSADTFIQMTANRFKYLDTKNKAQEEMEEKLKKLNLPVFTKVISLPNLNKKESFDTAKYNIEFQQEIKKFKKRQTDLFKDLQALEPSIIQKDHDAINGAKDILTAKSKEYLDVIFGPLAKKYAVLTPGDRNSINNFIGKVDPRAVKHKNFKAQLQRDFQLHKEDGSILPSDKKYLTNFKFKNGKKPKPKKPKMIDDLFLKPEQYVFLKDLDRGRQSQSSWQNQNGSFAPYMSFANATNAGLINLTHMNTVSKQRMRADILANRESIISNQVNSVKEMIRSRNSEVKVLGKLVSKCDSLNDGSKLSPKKSTKLKKKRYSQNMSPQPFNLETQSPK